MTTIADIIAQPVIAWDDLHTVKRMKAEAERKTIVDHYTKKVRQSIINAVTNTFKDRIFVRFNENDYAKSNADPWFSHNKIKSDPTYQILQEILETLRAMFPGVSIDYLNRDYEEGIYVSWWGDAIKPSEEN